MDPNEALRMARKAQAEVMALTDRTGPLSADEEWRLRNAAGDLAEHFGALDGWLSRGGFLPAAWQAGTNAERPAARRTQLHAWSQDSDTRCEQCGITPAQALNSLCPGRLATSGLDAL